MNPFDREMEPAPYFFCRDADNPHRIHVTGMDRMATPLEACEVCRAALDVTEFASPGRGGWHQIDNDFFCAGCFEQLEHNTRHVRGRPLAPALPPETERIHIEGLQSHERPSAASFEGKEHHWDEENNCY